jgi:hypothetical protein
MGSKRPQPKMFYGFSLEERVPQSHLLRAIVRRKDRKSFYGYKVHIGVDGGRARIVTSGVTTTGTVRENQVAVELLDRHRTITRTKPGPPGAIRRPATSSMVIVNDPVRNTNA